MIEKFKKSNKGFTLVELIVVIAILGVLMAVLVPQYIQYVEKAREGADLNTLGEIFHSAEINAASSESTPAAQTITIGVNSGTTAGVITIPADLQATLGSTANLKSSDGKAYAGTYYIVFDANGKAFWAASATATSGNTTDAEFVKLKDGKKGTT